ncbi:OmpA family protein [candidate division WOR-3 bacterium]|uniref:OmpA family protein n=1 Tax=candidate division WOR-3 bacterium TaxID=2052148 RepID=A0A938BTW1_UNCW3|nr:OmpA family protein [candidate division WOR-3 bacterium]
MVVGSPRTGFRRDRRPVLLCAIAALALVAAPAWVGRAAAATSRQFNSPTLLYETPTADVLPPGALALAADMTYPLVQTSQNVNYPEANVNIRFSPIKRLDFALTAYTFSDYVLEAKYRILGGEPDRFGLAVGVYDVGLNGYVSPVGHDTADAWPDTKYTDSSKTNVRTYESFSAFAVASLPVTRFARLNIGLGRGRFVGYSIHSKYFNSDFLLGGYHQWAVALFGGAEIYVLPHVALVAEASTRDLNAGVKANFGSFTATAAWTKMEGLVFSEGDERFGRLFVGASYQFNDLSGLAGLFRRRECPPPPEPVPPPPGPIEVPVGPAPSERKFELLPIYFDLDQSVIRPGDAEILKRNAEAILAKARAGLKADVLIEGHCCPLASEMYNVGLGMRRAEAAQAYLVGLGVDAALLTAESFGEANPPYTDTADYHLDRRCEFKWKY